MENNKKGTHTHFTRRPAEGRAEKVEYGRREGGYRPHREDYSTSRSFDSDQQPQRAYGARPARPARPQGERKSFGEHKAYGEGRPQGEHRAYGDRPQGERPYGERKPYGSKPHGDKPYGDKPRKSGYGKPSFGAKPGAPRGRKPVGKRSEADAGMSAMLSRKPQVSGSAWSDDDTAKTPIKEVVRLNKYIANSGVCSRREADTLIQSGVVTVNGEVVTELGTKVNVLTDDIRFNGERLKGEEKVYIVMNKPKGYVTTASDPHAEKTVMDILKGCPTRVFPVGRLDKNTTGVLMFTNDGEMAERLTHPSYNKKKIYQVVLDHPLTEEDKEKVLAGIELTDGVVAADELEYIDARDHRQLGIEIHSGKNRIVRRIFESMGYEVKALDPDRGRGEHPEDGGVRIMAHKAGFVNIIGNPNVGKSTLMNALVGEKLSIVTAKAQTTRHRIMGIVNGEDYQIVYSDTPGILKPNYRLQQSMLDFVDTAIGDADIILYVTDTVEKGDKNEAYIEKLAKVECPVVLVINKIDISTQEKVVELMQWWHEKLPKAEIIPASAQEKFNLESILEAVSSRLPEAPAWFDKDQFTDKNLRFFASEILREKIFLNYGEEIPYSCQVEIEAFHEGEERYEISAVIYVMRESQKGIIIGKKGAALKKVGTEARLEMEDFFQKKVFLSTFVKVDPDWRESRKELRRFGYEF